MFDKTMRTLPKIGILTALSILGSANGIIEEIAFVMSKSFTKSRPVWDIIIDVKDSWFEAPTWACEEKKDDVIKRRRSRRIFDKIFIFLELNYQFSPPLSVLGSPFTAKAGLEDAWKWRAGGDCQKNNNVNSILLFLFPAKCPKWPLYFPFHFLKSRNIPNKI